MNRGTRISEGRKPAKAECEADRWFKYHGYRLKGKAGSKRPIPMTSMKSLPTNYYRLKSSHAVTGMYLKWFGYRQDNKFCWCRGGTLWPREHLFSNCSRWKDQRKACWKAVGKGTQWKAGRCRHVQSSELFAMEKCDKPVIDILAATDIRKCPLKQTQQ